MRTPSARGARRGNSRRRVPGCEATSARPRSAGRRRAAAAVELALLIPLLAFLFVVALDFGRVFYFSLTLENCARAGALYGRDPHVADESPFATVQEAALADGTNLSPSPTIKSIQGTDAAGRSYVEVTAEYQYQTVVQFPGVPSQLILSRSVRMYLAPLTPNAS